MSLLEDEKKVGAMLRFMTGDIGLSIKNELVNLYGNTEAGRQCAKWHWLLVKFSPDPVQVRRYISIIEFAFEYDILLDDLQSWKKTMRILLPEEFMYKMAKFSQVPQLAIMDDGHAERRQDYLSEIRDASDVEW